MASSCCARAPSSGGRLATSSRSYNHLVLLSLLQSFYLKAAEAHASGLRVTPRRGATLVELSPERRAVRERGL